MSLSPVPQKMACLSSDEDAESGLLGSMIARGDKGKPNGIGSAISCSVLTLLLCVVASALLMESCGYNLKMRSECVVNNAPLDSILADVPTTTTVDRAKTNATQGQFVTLPAVIRDFKESHDDFEQKCCEEGGFDPSRNLEVIRGLVKDRLGRDGKPVYMGGH